jgi:cation transport ATPase
MATLASLGNMLALMQAATVSLQTGVSGPVGMDLKTLEAIPILSTSVLGGRLLKAILSQRNRVFATPLSTLVPATATVYSKSDHTSVPIDLLSTDDSVMVSRREYIPCDGVLESTESALITENWISGSLGQDC